MHEGPPIARVASLLGDPARATMILALMGGRALTATELASLSNISKQTASAHLNKLLDASLLTVQKQGRHRYHQIADNDVAELVEKLLGVAERTGARTLVTGPRDPALRKARVCYDHLAGELAVRSLEHALQCGWLQESKEAVGNNSESTPVLSVTAKGFEAYASRGLDMQILEQQRRPACRACLDWSVRRHHLAGALGAQLLALCIRKRWARRVTDSRVVRFSKNGEAKFVATFCK